MHNKAKTSQHHASFQSRSRATLPGATGATARVGTIMAIPTVLKRLGVNPAELLAELRLDPVLFDDADNLISYAARCRLLNLCVRRTGCNHFGLLVGQEEGLHSLGAIGYLAQSSQDVGSALRSICEFMHIQAQGVEVSIVVDGPSAVFRYEIYESEVEAVDQTYDAAVAIMFNIMQTLCGEDWRPARVLFAHRRPKDVAPYRRLFQAPLDFDADYNGLLFAATDLNRKSAGFDPVLHHLMQKQVDALKAEYGDAFESQVMRLLRTAVLTGECSEDRIADAFAIDARTLRRRLRESGTGFRELKQRCRLEVARQLLETSDMDVAAIAETLQYANSSAFTRAFRRWSGTAPTQWRAARRHANIR